MSGRQPDFRYECFDVTVPPATLKTAPVVVDVSTRDIALVHVEVLVPPGPSGAVGFQVTLAGQTIIPWQKPSVWIVEDDREITFDVGMEVDQGLRVNAYNLGSFPHTLRFRFKVQDIAPSTAILPFVPLRIVSGG